MKTIDVIGMMKTVAVVTPLGDDNKFLIKYGKNKRAVITVEDSPLKDIDEISATEDLYPRFEQSNAEARRR